MRTEKDMFTIWTAPASEDVPSLHQLNMRAPLSGVRGAKQRAEQAKERVKATLASYVSRPSAESLRKLVK